MTHFVDRKTELATLEQAETRGLLVNWQNDSRQAHYVLFGARGFTDELLALARVRDDVRLVTL